LRIALRERIPYQLFSFKKKKFNSFSPLPPVPTVSAKLEKEKHNFKSGAVGDGRNGVISSMLLLTPTLKM
jgi:hypothetical protein